MAAHYIGLGVLPYGLADWYHARCTTYIVFFLVILLDSVPMTTSVLAILGGFILLIWSADRFIAGAAAAARRLGASPLLIGLTIVALGTSAPEILVSTVASFQGNPGLAVGNALGSNITNIGLILGTVAIIKPLQAHSGVLRRELPIVLVTSSVVYLLCMDQNLGRLDSLVLFAGAVAFVIFLAWMAKNGTGADDPIESEYNEELSNPMPMGRAVFWIVIGMILLPVSSQLLVWGAVNIAQHFGVSDLVIGLTIVAIGTSLPELAASLAGVMKNEHDIALGNVLGSNMFNLLLVLAVPGLVAPGAINPEVLQRDIPVMLMFTAALFLMCYPLRDRSKSGRINRFEAGLLLAGFLAYEFVLYQSVISA